MYNIHMYMYNIYIIYHPSNLQVRWVIYSPSPLQTPWGHFSFIVLSIFVKIPVFPGCHSNFLKSHFVFPKSHLAFQRVLA